MYISDDMLDNGVVEYGVSPKWLYWQLGDVLLTESYFLKHPSKSGEASYQKSLSEAHTKRLYHCILNQ